MGTHQQNLHRKRLVFFIPSVTCLQVSRSQFNDRWEWFLLRRRRADEPVIRHPPSQGRVVICAMLLGLVTSSSYGDGYIWNTAIQFSYLFIFQPKKKNKIKKHVAVPVCTGFALTLGGERCLRAAPLRRSGRLTERMSGHGMTTLRPFSDLFYFAPRRMRI